MAVALQLCLCGCGLKSVSSHSQATESAATKSHAPAKHKPAASHSYKPTSCAPRKSRIRFRYGPTTSFGMEKISCNDWS